MTIFFRYEYQEVPLSALFAKSASITADPHRKRPHSRRTNRKGSISVGCYSKAEAFEATANWFCPCVTLQSKEVWSYSWAKAHLSLVKCLVKRWTNCQDNMFRVLDKTVFGFIKAKMIIIIMYKTSRSTMCYNQHPATFEINWHHHVFIIV